MIKIDTKKWCGFSVNELFTPVAISNKLCKKDLIEDGSIPVYSSTTINNGIEGYCNKIPDFIVDEEKSLYLVFGDHTKSMNLVTESFCVMDNVKVLRPKYNKVAVNQFICTVWKKQIQDLGYARHWNIAKQVKIKLPITKNGDIDIKYIENYMNTIKEDVENRIKIFERIIKSEN